MDPPSQPWMSEGAVPRRARKTKKEEREPGSELGADRDAIKREVKKKKARALSEEGSASPRGGGGDGKKELLDQRTKKQPRFAPCRAGPGAFLPPRSPGRWRPSCPPDPAAGTPSRSPCCGRAQVLADPRPPPPLLLPLLFGRQGESQPLPGAPLLPPPPRLLLPGRFR